MAGSYRMPDPAPQNLTIDYVAIDGHLLAVDDATVTLPTPGAVADPVTVTLD